MMTTMMVDQENDHSWNPRIQSLEPKNWKWPLLLYRVFDTRREQHDAILDSLQLLQLFLFQQFYEFSPWEHDQFHTFLLLYQRLNKCNNKIPNQNELQLTSEILVEWGVLEVVFHQMLIFSNIHSSLWSCVSSILKICMMSYNFMATEIFSRFPSKFMKNWFESHDML